MFKQQLSSLLVLALLGIAIVGLQGLRANSGAGGSSGGSTVIPCPPGASSASSVDCVSGTNGTCTIRLNADTLVPVGDSISVTLSVSGGPSNGTFSLTSPTATISGSGTSYTVIHNVAESVILTAKYEYAIDGVTDSCQVPKTIEFIGVAAVQEAGKAPAAINILKGSTVNLEAVPTGSAFPDDEPEWSDESTTLGTGAQLALPPSVTGNAGTHIITVACGSSSKDITINVIDIASMQVRRMGESSWSSSATIAAGANNTDVHKAEIAITLSTAAPVGTWSLDLIVTVSGASGEDVEGEFSIGSTSQSGDGTGTFPVTQTNITGTYRSSDKTDSDVTITCGSLSVTVSQMWDDETDATAEWSYVRYFNYDDYESVSLTLELDESTPIDDHDLEFKVTSVSYWQFDWDTWEWIDHANVTTNLDIYSKFRDSANGSGDGTVSTDDNGTATAYQIVYAEPGDDWTVEIYEVFFRANDTEVKK